MPYKYQAKLRKRAELFIEMLAKAEIEGAILPGSFRDYLVKVFIRREGKPFGYVNLYYSPTKERFTLKTNELKNKTIIPDLKACWNPFSPEYLGITRTAVVTEYQAYVDGSCLDEAIGYGVIVLKVGKLVAELYGPVQDETLQSMRQVGGELQAVYKTMEWCQANEIQGKNSCDADCNGRMDLQSHDRCGSQPG